MSREIAPKATEQIAILEGLLRKPTKRIVLLYSAGADSTAAGMELVRQGYEVQPLVFDYGQNAAGAEMFLAQEHAQKLGFNQPKFLEIAALMTALSSSSLIEGDGAEALDDDDAWVPARNTILMIIAGSYAYKVDADGISVGMMLEDNGVFGDSNREHHKLTELVLSKSLSRPMEVFLPLQSMTKRQVLEYLIEHDALEYTTSCWNAKVEDGEVRVCNQCANCQERNKNLELIFKTSQAEDGEVENNSPYI